MAHKGQLFGVYAQSCLPPPYPLLSSSLRSPRSSYPMLPAAQGMPGASELFEVLEGVFEGAS